MNKVLLFLLILPVFYSCSGKSEKEEKNQIDSLSNQEQTLSGPAKSEDFEVKYPNGKLKIKGVLKNGKREGLWISWYESGQEWSEGTYKNGLKNGPATVWHENGMKRYEGFYTNDERSGKWTYWDESGKVVDEIDQKKNKNN
jgi:antitoxin component YwqK of YwqJK toxin-antitoxin module